MNRYRLLTLAAVLWSSALYAQPADTLHIAVELRSQTELMKSADTRTRVDALHRVWNLALEAPDSENKIRAIRMIVDPVNSSSDQIRMPAVFALAEIANSSKDPAVKIVAIHALRGPIGSGQVPIRDVAIDAINNITANARKSEIALAAVILLHEPLESSNNGVRIPAINATVNAIVGSDNSAAAEQAIQYLLDGPMAAQAAIGGMELRMMAIHAIERIGMDSADSRVKTKAMVALEAGATRGSFEPEAKQRAKEAATRIQSALQ
ncbi:MAG TPA: hypothetical protein VFY29_05300 [Terriglobia bacterium]|nr:hypothetical protein [Terriglobia bacterium]